MESTHPSLWRTTLSAFLRAFAGLFGLVIGLFLSLIVLGLLFSQQEQHQELSPAPLTLKPVVMPDEDGEVTVSATELPYVLQLSVRSVIGTPGADRKWIDQVISQLQRPPFAKRKLAGILIILRTPGGTADDSAAIYHRICNLKRQTGVPVVALIEGLCASGGMYIASSADFIVSEPESIVGSIGVLFGPNFNLVGGMEKLGIQAFTLTQGQDKDTGNPFRPWKDDEFKPLEHIASSVYDDFVCAVAQARPCLTPDQIQKVLGARIFTSRDAVRLHLIDGDQCSRAEALKMVRSHAGQEKVQVIEFQPPLQVFEELFNLGSQTLYRVSKPWSPSWMRGIEGRMLLISPALAGD